MAQISYTNSGFCTCPTLGWVIGKRSYNLPSDRYTLFMTQSELVGYFEECRTRTVEGRLANGERAYHRKGCANED